MPARHVEVSFGVLETKGKLAGATGYVGALGGHWNDVTEIGPGPRTRVGTYQRFSFHHFQTADASLS
jgi:hypothetical protein